MALRTRSSETQPQMTLLIDHLSVVAQTGRALIGRRHESAADEVGRAAECARIAGNGRAAFLAEVGTLETVLIGRLLQARRWAGEVTIRDGALRSVVRLFLAANAQLADRVAGDGRRAKMAFDSGSDAFAYMRSRALVPAEISGSSLLGRIEVTRAFRLWGVVPLGDTLDATDAMLRALGVFDAPSADHTGEPTFDVLLAELRQAS